MKIVSKLIIVILITLLFAPLVEQAGKIIGINISPLVVCVVLLLLAWALG